MYQLANVVNVESFDNVVLICDILLAKKFKYNFFILELMW
jgi:hypothetical protein